MENFSSEEHDFLSQKEIYTIKKEVTEKLKVILMNTSEKISGISAKNLKVLPEKILTKGKISKGENYQGYPYIILDNPRLFNQHSILVYRTMILYGHYASCHLQIHGDFLNQYKNSIYYNLKNFSDGNYYIPNGPSPWIYHLEDGGFDKLNMTLSMNDLFKHSFFKISSFLPISEIENLPDLSSLTFEKCLTLLQ